MSKVAKSFIYRGCLNPVTTAVRTSVDIGASAKLELELRVQDQGEDQRRPGKRLYVRTVKHVS